MGRTSDVPELVKLAAKALLAKGQRPTVAAVRERIGKGSNTTILKALKEWEQAEGLELKVQSLAASGAKVDVQDLISLMSSLLESNKKTQIELSEVKSEFSHFRNIHSDRLNAALNRLEDAYKILMVAADASRNESSRWKEKLDRQEIDFFNRENIFKQQIASLEARLGERNLNKPSSSLQFLPVEEKANPLLPNPILPIEAKDVGNSAQRTRPHSSPGYFYDDHEESPYE